MSQAPTLGEQAACKLGTPQLCKERSWCVTHNRMLHFCDPDPRSEEGTMKQARHIVLEFWRSLPEYHRTLWLLEGPCEELIETIFTSLIERNSNATTNTR